MSNSKYLQKWKTALKESKDGKLSYYATVPIMAEFVSRISDAAQLKFVDNFKEEVLKRNKYASGKLFNSSDFFKTEAAKTKRFPNYTKEFEISMDYDKLPDYFHDIDRGVKSKNVSEGEIKKWIRDKRKYYTKFNIQPSNIGLRKQMMSFYYFDSKGIPHKMRDIQAALMISNNILQTGIKSSKYIYKGSLRHRIGDSHGKEHWGIDAVYGKESKFLTEEVLEKNKKWLLNILERAEVDVEWSRRSARIKMNDRMLDVAWEKVGNKIVDIILSNWLDSIYSYFVSATTGKLYSGKVALLEKITEEYTNKKDIDWFSDDINWDEVFDDSDTPLTKKVVQSTIQKDRIKKSIYYGRNIGEVIKDYLLGILKTNTDAINSAGEKTGEKTKFHPPGLKSEAELKRKIAVEVLSSEIFKIMTGDPHYEEYYNEMEKEYKKDLEEGKRGRVFISKSKAMKGRINKEEKKIIDKMQRNLSKIVDSYKKLKISEAELGIAIETNANNAVIDLHQSQFDIYTDNLKKSIDSIFKNVVNITKKQFKELTDTATVSKECENLITKMVDKYAKGI